MARNSNLQIRLTDEERARVDRIAVARDLAASTWARTILLREMRRIEALEARKATATPHDATSTESGDPRSRFRRVAEPGTPPTRKRGQ